MHGNHCHQAGRLQSDKLECSQGYYRFGTSLTEPIQEPILLRQYSVLTRSNILWFWAIHYIIISVAWTLIEFQMPLTPKFSITQVFCFWRALCVFRRTSLLSLRLMFHMFVFWRYIWFVGTCWRYGVCGGWLWFFVLLQSLLAKAALSLSLYRRWTSESSIRCRQSMDSQ